jgi:hypothetical protein
MSAPRFKNPWALEDDVEDVRPVRPPAEEEDPDAQPTSGGEAYDPRSGGILAVPKVDLRVPAYGGFTVAHAQTPTEGLLKVLDALVTNLKDVDPVLVEYEVLVSQLRRPPQGGFYVYRKADGWALTVPSAETRDQALFQLTQALLALFRGKQRRVLLNAHINPYRL